MSKHTPGPWKVEPHSSHEMAFLVTSTAPQSVGGDRTVMVTKFASRDDAHLIAAAPDLLEVAKECEAYFRPMAEDGQYLAQQRIDHIRAAIAKAEGGS